MTPDPRTVELGCALYEAAEKAAGALPLPWDEVAGEIRANYLAMAEQLQERFIVVPADTARTGWIDPERDREHSTIVVWPDAIREIAAPGALVGWYRAVVVPDPRTEATALDGGPPIEHLTIPPDQVGKYDTEAARRNAQARIDRAKAARGEYRCPVCGERSGDPFGKHAGNDDRVCPGVATFVAPDPRTEATDG